MQKANTIGLIFFSLLTIALIAGGTFAIGWFLSPRPNVTPCPDIQECPDGTTPTPVSPEADESKNFAYDRIIINGTDNLNENFFVILQLSRILNESNTYDHQYTAYYSYMGDSGVKWHTYKSNSIDVAKGGFLTSYSREQFPDFSTRETIDIGINLEDFAANIEISDINGDFIVKNQPDYTRYISSSTADVKLSGNSFQTKAEVNTIYSNDSSTSIFFEGRDELVSQTHSITLWDNEDNFYLVDTTNVENRGLPYTSHQWAIHKDASQDASFKAFAVDIDFDQTNKVGQRWDITIQDIKNTEIQIEATEFLTKEKERGLVKGIVTDVYGQREVYGYFAYIEDNR